MHGTKACLISNCGANRRTARDNQQRPLLGQKNRGGQILGRPQGRRSKISAKADHKVPTGVNSVIGPRFLLFEPGKLYLLEQVLSL